MTYSFDDCGVVMVAKMKGGSGVSTTTLLTAFAYALAHTDKRVGLICADNTTYTISTFMSRARQAHPDVKPPVYTYQWKERFGLLTDCVIEFASDKELDVVFIDMAPDAELYRQSVGLADLVVSPTQCKLADAERAFAVHDIANEHNIPVIISLNRMSKPRQGQARIWRDYFEDEGIIVSDHEAAMHSDYARIWGDPVERVKKDHDGNPIHDEHGRPVKYKDVEVVYPEQFGAYKGLAKEIAAVIG